MDNKGVVVVGASSKVLVTGGYLITQAPNTGIVFQTTPKFYTQIQPNQDCLIVDCPQLNYSYKYINKVQQQNNQFIDRCIIFIEKFLVGQELYSCKLTLFGDNQFYSQRGTDYFPNCLADQPAFDQIQDIQKKTGMGSSASLIVSLLGAIKAYFNLQFDLHPYCQLLNAFVQEKIGSGFDIAAALYGTQIYQRFTNIKQMNEALEGNIQPFLDTFDYQYKALSEHNLDLVIIDVASGSDTRVMVKQILQWSESFQAGPLKDKWFSQLNELYSQVQVCLLASDYQKLRILCQEVRTIIQFISSQSGIMIEPPTTTLLLDELLSEFSPQELWYAGVPGAGGDDAIFAIGPKGSDLKNKVKMRFTQQRPNLAVLDIDIQQPKKLTDFGTLDVKYL